MKTLVAGCEHGGIDAGANAENQLRFGVMHYARATLGRAGV